VDGAVIYPGQTFSVNETVGERTEEDGYMVAKIIVPSGYTDGVGGGVCQTASTLHAAAFYAGLDIKERHPHRFRVKYVPAGLDATVDYGSKDLRIVNNTMLPVVFQMGLVDKGELVARVMGPMRTWSVRYKFEVIEERPSDIVTFELAEDIKDVLKFWGRPALKIEKKIYRKDLAKGKYRRIKVREDDYKASPWTLRVTEYPSGKKSVSGLTQREIQRLLNRSPYKVENARFEDVQVHGTNSVRIPHVSEKEFARFQRFSEFSAPPSRPVPKPESEAEEEAESDGKAVLVDARD